MEGGMVSQRSSFGQVLKRPSGRYRARYTEPGAVQRWVSAPTTFDTKRAAELWLARERTAIEDRRAEAAAAARDGRPPTTAEPVRPVSFGDYGHEWLLRRRLKESTRTLYARQLPRRSSASGAPSCSPTSPLSGSRRGTRRCCPGGRRSVRTSTRSFGRSCRPLGASRS